MNMIRCILSGLVMSGLMVAAKDVPVMGWSSWNTYRVNISDSLIMGQAYAMVRHGLDSVGYRFINIDDGYFGGRDTATGELLIHPTRFPGGLKPVVDHIHSLGLRAGIYSDAGVSTCGFNWDNDTIARNVGLYGHEIQDCRMFFGDLGFDFIKVDYCGGTARQNKDHLSFDPEERYRIIREAMDATGRGGLLLNVCRWDYPGTWVDEVADSWRMSTDINCSWRSIENIIRQNLYLSAYAERGHNDMDMLEVGRTLTDEEDRTHFGMWCIMSSPLLIGCDMTQLRPETLRLLKNTELIALNQDPLGLQAYVASHDGETYVLVKDVDELYGASRAVALYNPSDSPDTVTLRFSDIDLDGKVRMRDLFEHKDLGSFEDEFSVEVPAHGVRIYRAVGDIRKERSVYEAETAYMTAYQELYNPVAVGTAAYMPDSLCSGGVKAANLGYRPDNDIVWRHVRSEYGGGYELQFAVMSDGDREMYVSVNGGPGTLVKVPDSGSGLSTVSVDADLLPGDNAVRLYNDGAVMPEVDKMELVKK